MALQVIELRGEHGRASVSGMMRQAGIAGARISCVVGGCTVNVYGCAKRWEPGESEPPTTLEQVRSFGVEYGASLVVVEVPPAHELDADALLGSDRTIVLEGQDLGGVVQDLCAECV